MTKKDKNKKQFYNAFGYNDNTPEARLWWVDGGHKLKIRDENNYLRRYESKKGYDGGES